MIKRAISEISKNKKSIFWLLVFLVLFYFILPDKQTIESTIDEIKGADLSWIIIGNIFYYITIPLYTIQLIVLSMKKLNKWVAFNVQMSVLFINKLLPGAVCSFVMNTFYLNKVGHSSPQVASVIAMKAVTSSIPFTLLLIASVFIGLTRFQLSGSLGINIENIDWHKIIVLAVILILIIGFTIYSSSTIKNFINKSLESFWSQFKDYKKRPWDIVWAMMTGFLAPVFGVLVLYASAKSVGLDISFTQSFLVYTLGTTFANIIPIPGGVGAAEAGLYAGFTIFGFPPAESMAAAVIFRIITFWIPGIPGFISFISLRKNVLKGFSLNWKMPEKNAKKVAKA